MSAVSCRSLRNLQQDLGRWDLPEELPAMGVLSNLLQIGSLCFAFTFSAAARLSILGSGLRYGELGASAATLSVTSSASSVVAKIHATWRQLIVNTEQRLLHCMFPEFQVGGTL